MQLSITSCGKPFHASMTRFENIKFCISNLHLGLNNFILCPRKDDIVYMKKCSQSTLSIPFRILTVYYVTALLRNPVSGLFGTHTIRHRTIQHPDYSTPGLFSSQTILHLDHSASGPDDLHFHCWKNNKAIRSRNMKGTWKIINNILHENSCPAVNSFVTENLSGGNIIHDSKEIVSKFNDFFVKSARILQKRLLQEILILQ